MLQDDNLRRNRVESHGVFLVSKIF